MILGIDEAGRGPVIGPLVIAAVLVEEGQLQRLEELGVRDSKRIPRPQRTALAAEIRKFCQVLCKKIPPAALDRASLTEVELRAIAELIAASIPSPEVVQLDAPVPPRAIPRYAEELRARLPRRLHSVKLQLENRADERYLTVSAASIVAKVERDEAILRLHERYGDFGWGYPTEQKVREFLERWYREHGSFPACVRRKWRTAQRLLQPPRAEDR